MFVIDDASVDAQSHIRFSHVEPQPHTRHVPTPGHRGFTLLELMVTLAIAVIILTFASASYSHLIRRSVLTTFTNELVAGLHYARYAAIARNETVTVCPRSNANACGTRWLNGWVIHTGEHADETTRLRVHPAVTADGLSIVKNTTHDRIRYDGSGFNASALGATLTFTDATRTQTTCIIMAANGRIRSRPDPMATTATTDCPRR